MKKILSGIVIYHTDSGDIACYITHENIKIVDAYLVTNDEDKKMIIENLLDSFDWYKENRTNKDVLCEWKTHNAFYQRKWLVTHTKDTDIELKQSWFKKLLYKICSKVIKEKKV